MTPTNELISYKTNGAGTKNKKVLKRAMLLQHLLATLSFSTSLLVGLTFHHSRYLKLANDIA